MDGCIGCGEHSFALKHVCVACYRRMTEKQRDDYYMGWLTEWRLRRILIGERGPVIHEVKIHPMWFAAITERVKEFGREAAYRHEKTHEVRRADRDYRVGDILHLREWGQDSGTYTGREDSYTGREDWFDVTHITEPGTYGLPETVCVMSIAESWPERVHAIRDNPTPVTPSALSGRLEEE